MSSDEPRKSAPFQQYEVASMFGRLGGAWQEYNMRVSARHALIGMWLTGSGVLLGAFASARYGAAITLLIGLAIPSLAWATFQLLYLHDVMLANLTNFMRSAEEHNNPSPSHSSDCKLPSYHADREYTEGILEVRGIQNIVLRLSSLTMFLVQCVFHIWVHVLPTVENSTQGTPVQSLEHLFWSAARVSAPFVVALLVYAMVWYYADEANMNGIRIRKSGSLKHVRKEFLRTVPPGIRWIVNVWWSTHLSTKRRSRTVQSGRRMAISAGRMSPDSGV